MTNMPASCVWSQARPHRLKKSSATVKIQEAQAFQHVWGTVGITLKLSDPCKGCQINLKVFVKAAKVRAELSLQPAADAVQTFEIVLIDNVAAKTGWWCRESRNNAKRHYFCYQKTAMLTLWRPFSCENKMIFKTRWCLRRGQKCNSGRVHIGIIWMKKNKKTR